MTSFEQIQREALNRLAVASDGDLKRVAEEIAIPPADVAKAEVKGSLGLQRVIRRYLDSDDLVDAPDGGKAVWVKVVDLLVDVVRVEANSKEADTKEVPVVTMEEDKSTTESQTSDGAGPKTINVPAPFTTWRKEFRIVGQVGEPGQKDRLSFVSLARQVENGIRKGFPKEEIIEAVIRSVVPGLRLRSYLEGRDDLSLPDLRRILRAHYREKDATAVFQELSTAAQQQKETPHDFVLRVLDLKQKVTFASQEAGAGVTYDPTQVHQMALRSISTGIANEAVQVEIRPHLQTEGVTDEVLLEALTAAVEHEQERAQKLKPKGARAATIEATSPKPSETSTTAKNPPPSNSLDLKELTASIQAIVKAEVNALRSEGKTAASSRQRERGCPSCRKAGTGNTCDHCFRCGSGEHYLRGCRAKKEGQGNGKGLQERDAQ